MRLATVAALVAGVVAAAAPVGHAADVPLFAGSLPDTSSATTATGRGEFAGLSVHVNQTADLTTQALSLSWSWPGHSTRQFLDGLSNERPYGGDFLQIMQCWGDPVSSAAAGDAIAEANYVPGNEGPPREQCEFGGVSEGGGLTNVAEFPQVSRLTGDHVDSAPVLYGQETAYSSDPLSTSRQPEVPFRPVVGDPVLHQSARDGWANTYFGKSSTNEVGMAPVYGDGTGGTAFQAQNSLDASALGCGSGATKCWLVVVPHTDTFDLAGTKPIKAGSDPGSARPPRADGLPYRNAALASPLASSNWANRIAIPLDFRSTASPCASATSNYTAVGSDLASDAMLSWQAELCSQSGAGGVGYSFTSTPDEDARSSLSGGSSEMRLLSAPVPPDEALQPIVYAPVTASAITIGFVFDPGTGSGDLRRPVPTMKLNQRLVAKLLTSSYIQANAFRINPNNVFLQSPAPTAYTWLAKNPLTLLNDPEFRELNPDVFEAYPDLATYDSTTARYFGSLQVSAFGADGYRRLWQWILAEPSAKAFLEGTPDKWGTVVDPYFIIGPKNPQGAGAFDPTSLDQFPSLDPWTGFPGSGTTPPCAGDPKVPTEEDRTELAQRNLLTMPDLRPYAADKATVARDVARVDGLNKTASFLCPSSDTDTGRGGWKGGYDYPAPGERRLVGLTDSVSSARYGVLTAALPNAAGVFVAPDSAGVSAALNHLVPVGGVQGFVQPDPSTDDRAAYPLAELTYAGVTTDNLDDAGCAAFASLLNYAAFDGQNPGVGLGDLPRGYTPLPGRLRQQTADAARTVAACAKKPAEEPPADEQPVTQDPAGTTTDSGNTEVSTPDAPADATSGDVSSVPSTTTPPVSLAANRGTTKPDPSVIAWVIPVALLVGFLALLAGPLAGLRRRRPDQPTPGGSG